MDLWAYYQRSIKPNLIGFFIAAFIFITGTAAFISEILELGITEVIQTVTSATLTAMLILLYKEQKDILEEQSSIQEKQVGISSKQSEIMKNQEKWMSRRHEPEIAIDKWEIQNEDLSSYLELSNFGGGTAIKPTIRLKMIPYEEPKFTNASKYEFVINEDRAIPNSLPDRFLDTDKRNLLDSEGLLSFHREDIEASGLSERIIEPGEYEIPFSTKFGIDSFLVSTEEDPKESESIETIDFFQLLADHGVSELFYKFELEYRYAGSHRDSREICGGYIQPSEIESLLDLVLAENIQYLPMDTVTPELSKDISE